MARSKYGKYILRQTKPQPEALTPVPTFLKGAKDWAGIQPRMNWKNIAKPVVMDMEPHSHDFDEFLCFVGGDPSQPFDLGAEVEVTLGKKVERHTIDTATIVCIPKGLVHGRINFKKINKPIVFCNMYLSPEYVMRSS